MKKFLSILLLGALLSTGIFSVSSFALFGGGVAVIANEVQLIKSGLLGHKLCFTDGDFKSAFAVTDFSSITVTKLPSSAEGTLLLAGRRVKEGQTIKRRNLSALVFVPESKEITEARFTFKLDGKGEYETECIMKFIDRINYAPEVPKDKTASLSIVTQAEIAIGGKINATDPEGDELEYMVVTYPKNGTLTLWDKTEGRYRYTPMSNFTGYDSFCCVVRDEYGNYSDVVTVGIRTTERMSSEVFVDMTDRDEYNAAVAMSAIGVMSGKTVGDDIYFCPEETVSRAEFVAMAMKAYGIRKDTTLTSSFFDDNKDIPTSLVCYVATAERMGIVDGSIAGGKLLFEPNRAITKYEAAMIMARIVGIGESEEDEEYLENASVPIFARASIGAMVTLGVFASDGDATDYTLPVTRADAASYLYKLISV